MFYFGIFFQHKKFEKMMYYDSVKQKNSNTLVGVHLKKITIKLHEIAYNRSKEKQSLRNIRE